MMPFHRVFPTNILTFSEAEGWLPSHPRAYSDRRGHGRSQAACSLLHLLHGPDQPQQERKNSAKENLGQRLPLNNLEVLLYK